MVVALQPSLEDPVAHTLPIPLRPAAATLASVVRFVLTKLAPHIPTLEAVIEASDTGERYAVFDPVPGELVGFQLCREPGATGWVFVDLAKDTVIQAFETLDDIVRGFDPMEFLTAGWEVRFPAVQYPRCRPTAVVVAGAG